MVKLKLKNKVSLYVLNNYDKLVARLYKAIVYTIVSDSTVLRRKFGYTQYYNKEGVHEFVGVHSMVVDSILMDDYYLTK